MGTLVSSAFAISLEQTQHDIHLVDDLYPLIVDIHIAKPVQKADMSRNLHDWIVRQEPNKESINLRMVEH